MNDNSTPQAREDVLSVDDRFLVTSVQHAVDAKCSIAPTMAAAVIAIIDRLCSAAQASERAVETLPFRVLLDWFMSSDPWPMEEGHGEIEALLNRLAAERGWLGWVQAYHGARTPSSQPAPPWPKVNMTLTPSWVWKIPSKEAPPQAEPPTDAEIEAARKRVEWAKGIKWSPRDDAMMLAMNANEAERNCDTLLRALDAARDDIGWWEGLYHKTEEALAAQVAQIEALTKERDEAREEACPGLETCERKDDRIRELEAVWAAAQRERDELLVSERAMGGRLETLVKEVDAQAERREVHPVGTAVELAAWRALEPELTRLRALLTAVEDDVGAEEFVDVYAQYGRAGAGMAIAAYRAALRRGETK